MCVGVNCVGDISVVEKACFEPPKQPLPRTSSNHRRTLFPFLQKRRNHIIWEEQHLRQRAIVQYNELVSSTTYQFQSLSSSAKNESRGLVGELVGRERGRFESLEKVEKERKREGKQIRRALREAEDRAERGTADVETRMEARERGLRREMEGVKGLVASAGGRIRVREGRRWREEMESERGKLKVD